MEGLQDTVLGKASGHDKPFLTQRVKEASFVRSTLSGLDWCSIDTSSLKNSVKNGRYSVGVQHLLEVFLSIGKEPNEATKGTLAAGCIKTLQEHSLIAKMPKDLFKEVAKVAAASASAA